MSYPLQIISVIAVLKHENKYLLVQRGLEDEIFPGRWQNLGGKVELGERLEEALRREIREEVGLELAREFEPKFLQSYSWKKDDDGLVRMGIIFLIKLDDVPDKISLCSELNNFGWFTFEEIKGLRTIGQDSPTGTLGQIEAAEKY